MTHTPSTMRERLAVCLVTILASGFLCILGGAFLLAAKWVPFLVAHSGAIVLAGIALVAIALGCLEILRRTSRLRH